MRKQTWTTADVSAGGRFDAWSDALSATHLDWELVGRERDFNAEIVARDVDDLRLVGCRCDPCEGFRSSRHINRTNGDYIGILFELSGSEVVRQGDQEAILRPGDFVIWDSRKAMEFRVLEPLHKMTILVPKKSMRRFLPEIDELGGMRVEGTEKLGPLVGAHLGQLASGLDHFEDEHLRLVADTTLELVSAGIRAKRGPQSGSGKDHYDRICRFIIERLADPDLNPAEIAEANSISLRYLHKLFSTRGQSVSRWILTKRLQRCRQAIEMESQPLSITEIALAWGFNDGSHFSRSFRNEFGIAPRSMRKLKNQPGEY
ncbi:helix-turn-helix domain-containing protein [Bosea sp. MMO-172]|uniref:helix-turn-helix domain-containing protein n=1 Tax=Bosea sp. MMO-172 TaxID=3127885 RepID=UPI00301B07E0